MLRPRIGVALVVLGACAPATVQTATGDVAPAAPATARQLVERMHESWTGKWYRTLEFRQENTIYSSVGETSAPDSARCWLMIRRFCMSGVSRQSGSAATSAHVTLSRPAHSLSSEVISR